MSRKSRRQWARDQARQADEALLLNRLKHLGLATKVEVHENRTVLVSSTKHGAVRVHRGFAYASDRTLLAILTFVDSSVRRRVRKAAEREVVSFPIDRYLPTRKTLPRRPRPKPGDPRIVARLKQLHKDLNELHFGGALEEIPFRISDRMRRKVGELTVDVAGCRALEIAISRRHLVKDSWSEVENTVLHEMIHQWQAESGLSVDHGAVFRSKAAAVGITEMGQDYQSVIEESADSQLVARVP